MVNGEFTISKMDCDQRLVFGWANVSVRADGGEIVDLDDDMIDVAVLEKAAYQFVLNYRVGGELHLRSDVATMVESMVFTKEKLEKMGVPEGILPQGWWIGFKIHDHSVWEKVKDGTYSMFSIEGTARRKEVI